MTTIREQINTATLDAMAARVVHARRAHRWWFLAGSLFGSVLTTAILVVAGGGL